MTSIARRNRKPLLAIEVADRRTVTGVLVGMLLWAIIGWVITSILAGRGQPFDYAVRSYSLGELRILLWSGTAVLTVGICAVGWSFVQLGRALWRDARGSSFGLRLSPNGDDALFGRLVRWYGGILVVAGAMLIPLGGALLAILATCRYMRDV